MNSVWFTVDNKIDRDTVKENYPVPIKVKMFEGGKEGVIKSISGGCFDYHKTMISKRNIAIFDTSITEGSFQRYSFVKNHEIYNELRNSSIENLLLMEYTLGIGYTNLLFEYLKNVDEYSKIQQFYPLIASGAENSHFYIRKQITKVIWEYVENEMNGGMVSDKCIKNAEIIMKKANSTVVKVMNLVLEVWWYLYMCKVTDYEWNALVVGAQTCWRKYFDEEIAYKEWITTCKTQDWRDVENVEAAFEYVDGLPYADEEQRINNFEHLRTTWLLRISDIDDNVRHLVVESPKNKIGEIVIERTVKKLKYEEFPESPEKLYSLYDEIKRKEFDKFKQEEKNKFNSVNLIIKPNTYKIKAHHVYALLNHTVIKKSLEKVEVSKFLEAFAP